MQAIIVINGNSGKRTPQKLAHKIARLAPEIPYKITYSVDDFHAFVQQHQEQFDVLIVAGGDGTVNAAVNYLQPFKNKALAVIPLGSGNGFAREAGFNIPLPQLFKSIAKGSTRKIDAIRINDMICDNVSGLGFDGAVAHAFAQLPHRGLSSYVQAFFQVVGSFKPFDATVTLPDKTLTSTYSGIILANSSQFGNNAHIAPMAQLDSQKYVLVLVKPIPLWAYPSLVLRMFNKTLDKSSYFTHVELTKEISIESSFNALHIDGEPLHHNGTIRVALQPEAIKILAI